MNPVSAPWVATTRTVLQNILGVILSILAAYMAFAAIAPDILEAVRDVLPKDVFVWLTGFVVSTGAIAGAIARVMAIPAVNSWLTRFRSLGYGSPVDEGLGQLNTPQEKEDNA